MITGKSDDDLEVVHGSDNIWQDFDYADADIRQAKGVLAAEIIRTLNRRKLSVRNAQKMTGFAAADFSRVRNADYGRFTIDRLIKMVNALDGSSQVTIDVQRRRNPHKHSTVPLAYGRFPACKYKST